MAKAIRMSPDEAARHQAKMGKPLGDRIYREPAPKKRAKYGNEVTIVDGVRMASKKEARRYRELGLLLKSGKIIWLARQVRFALPGGVEYICDFLYAEPIITIDGCRSLLVVEDVKSSATARVATYRIKKKLMLSTHGIEIKET